MLAYHDRLTTTQTRLLMVFFMHSRTDRSELRDLIGDGRKYPQRSIDILVEKRLINERLYVTKEGLKIVNEVGPFAAELAEMWDIGAEAIAMPKTPPPVRRHGFGPGAPKLVRTAPGRRKKTPLEQVSKPTKPKKPAAKSKRLIA